MSERPSTSSFLELLGAGEVRGAHEAAHGQGGNVLPGGVLGILGETEVDDLGHEVAVRLADEHEIRRLEVAVNETALFPQPQGRGKPERLSGAPESAERHLRAG